MVWPRAVTGRLYLHNCGAAFGDKILFNSADGLLFVSIFRAGWVEWV